MLDFFLSSLFWASIFMLCFFGILKISDWIITWKGLKTMDKIDKNFDPYEENQDE
jgi:hypothetical protein